MPPVITWEDPAATIPRGCVLCEHGRAQDPNATSCARTHEAFHVARSNAGSCGPDARHLTFHALCPPRPLGPWGQPVEV